MKKIRNIGLILGMIILISSTGKAQYYYTSYGYAHEWHLPKYVQYSIYDNYYGYDIAHVQRFHRHGYRNYNVLLHRNGWFVELRFDRHGHIYKTIRHRHRYPLMSHVCTNHCGYHKTYYSTYFPKYHHKHYHHGYSTTVYVNSDHHSYKKHHQNNYYSNVHVHKQHKQSSQNRQYNGHGNRNVNNAYSNNTDKQHRRTTTTIRKPQANTSKTIHPVRSQNNGRSKYVSGQKSASRTGSNNDAERNLVVYRNDRGGRNR